LALTSVMVGIGPACAEPFEDSSESTQNSNPEGRSKSSQEAAPSVMDPGMQHMQRGQPDSRASVAPPNRDPTMSTNPDAAPPSPDSGNAATERTRENQE
jgi:hypothetical protein